MDSYKNKGIVIREDMTPPLLTADSALFLDFDGTLVELAATPESVVISDTLVRLLLALRERLGGAVALVTGRRLESIDRWLPQRFCGAGLHGAQIRLGTQDEPIPTPYRTAADAIAQRLDARFSAVPGVLIENKGGAVALHYRQAPDHKAPCDAAMRELAQEFDLNVVVGHSVIEARPRGIDKGVGLARLMRSPTFAGRSPVFAGDDTTDEDAIVAAQRLGGTGIRVGAAETAAHHRLADVAAVHHWLERSLRSLAAQS